jgi:transcriptional regulator with XRE-family HTH domain
LRNLRTASGLTIVEVAKYLFCSDSQISRIETAQRTPTPRDIRDLCDLYEVAEPVRNQLMTLVRQARERSWWREYKDLGESAPFFDYQEGASAITEYETSRIPGLMQTEDYARAAVQGALPEVREDVLESRVAARLVRQELLARDEPPRFWALLDEAVLHRMVGGAAVMKAQFDRLCDLARLPHVTVQLIPFRIGAHPGMDSSFSLVEFAEEYLSPVVFVEGLAGDFFLERSGDILRYREAVSHLTALALGPDDSIDFIKRIQATI